MSRLSNETVHVWLHPERVVLARVAGRFSPRLMFRHEERVVPQAGSVTGAILVALENALQDKRWHAAGAKVLFSNTLVRYAVIPASDHIFTAADETELARLRFLQVYGGTESLEVRLGNLLSGCDQISAALERGFLLGLAQILKSAVLVASLMEPLFMRAFNRARRHIVARDFWFAQAEPGLLMLAHKRGQNWASLAAIPFKTPLSGMLPAKMLEAKLLVGPAGIASHLYLYAPGMDCSGCDCGSDFNLVDLAGLKAMRPGAADPVLCAAGAAA